MRLLQGPQGQIVGGEIRFNNKIINHTSFLVDRLVDDPAKWAFNSDIKEYYKNFLNDLSIEIFDFVREDNELKQIVEQLNNLCI